MESNFTDLYNKTKAGPNRALIGINYSKERKDDFKWVGPISKSLFYIFAKKSYGIGQEIGTPRDSIFQLPITDPQQEVGYIAFSLNTPQQTVAQWQAAPDAIKTEGASGRILLGWGLDATGL